MQIKHTRSIVNGALLGSVVGLWATIATDGVQAQNALGGGTALDSNLNAQTGKVNTGQRIENYADRNAIITGDVANGRGFRGSVGYTAPADFRGRTGSNDQFDFRAYAAGSAPDFLRAGSTLDQFRLGQTIGTVPYSRSASGQINPLEKSGFSPVEMSLTKRSLDRTSLSRSSPFSLQIAAEPSLVGLTYNADGQPVLINASPARGLYAQQFNQDVRTIGLTSYDAARVRQDQEVSKDETKKTPIGGAFETRFADVLLVTTSVDTKAGPERLNSDIQPDYKKILERIADRYAQRDDVKVEVEPSLMEQLDARYKELRQQLAGETPAPNAKPSEKAAIDPSGKPADKPLVPKSAGTDKPDATAKPDNTFRNPKPDKPSVDTIDFGAILRHGGKIDKLSTENQDRLNELISTAEQKLREGDYFWAERRFERALRFTPDHPLATAGIAHAQLGAGLYLSSALTLRNLFTRDPEMIDATYADSLLPAPARLTEATAKIRVQLKSPTDQASFGLLLAYIGRQTSDRGMIEEGLRAMGEAEPDSKLVPLLRSVWLGGESKDTDPKPAASMPADSSPLAEPGK